MWARTIPEYLLLKQTNLLCQEWAAEDGWWDTIVAACDKRTRAYNVL